MTNHIASLSNNALISAYYGSDDDAELRIIAQEIVNRQDSIEDEQVIADALDELS